MSKKPHHKGTLRKKIALRVPPLKPSLALPFITAEQRLKQEDTEFEEWVYDEGVTALNAERYKKLVRLADFYKLLPPKGTKLNEKIYTKIMARLAMALARDYVPGFQLELKMPKTPGAPREWTPCRLIELEMDVGEWLEKNPRSSVAHACKALAKRPRRQTPLHGWQHYDAETLRRRYHEAKSCLGLARLRDAIRIYAKRE